MTEVLPKASKSTRLVACELIKTILSTAGKEFSEKPRSPKQIKTFANAMADMFCAYLEKLQNNFP